MHISQHADQRMNQRGISRRLVEFTLTHGRVEGDRHALDRKESRRIIEALTEQLRLAKRTAKSFSAAIPGSVATCLRFWLGSEIRAADVDWIDTFTKHVDKC